MASTSDLTPTRRWPSPARWRPSNRKSSCSVSLLSSDSVVSESSIGSVLETPCMVRDTTTQDCTFTRFIAWAAVQRNLSTQMTAEDRLMCPLVQCRRRFSDHESMLSHLSKCDKLPTRQYWCYEHMRTELFDDSKCRRCLGHPSRRRKMISKAKHLLSSLSHRGDSTASLAGGLVDDILYDDEAADQAAPDSFELFSSEIVELEAPVLVHAGACNTAATRPFGASGFGATSSQQAAASIPLVDASAVQLSSHVARWQPFSANEVFPNATQLLTAQHPSTLSTIAETANQASCVTQPGSLSEVDLNTGLLSHSSSVRSTTSTTSNVSSIFSQVSACSAATSHVPAFESCLTSPVECTIDPSLLASNNSPVEARHAYETSFTFDLMCDQLVELPAEVPFFMPEHVPATSTVDLSLRPRPDQPTQLAPLNDGVLNSCQQSESIASLCWAGVEPADATTQHHDRREASNASEAMQLTEPACHAPTIVVPSPTCDSDDQSQFSPCATLTDTDNGPSKCAKCDYKPKGDPRWFHGSMAKHMKSAHSETPVIIYKCPFPGCGSQYRNRADNLKQHQQEKGHFVDEGDEAPVPRRPSKRKKLA